MGAAAAGALIAGRYRVTEVLGHGGMGDVLLVEEQIPPRRLLALKRFRLQSEPGADAVDILEREFHTLRELRHPHVAGVDAFGWMNDPGGGREAFFTAEYVAGPDLFTATRGAALDLIWALVAQLAGALAYVHARGIVHRDVKPGNVLVTRAGGEPAVKLIDFGLAAAAHLDDDGVPRGTVRYMAPEVIERGAVDTRADLYSLGITLYEVLTGAPPFQGSTREVLRQHLEARLRPPSELRPELGPEVDRLVLRLAAKDPRDRFRSADEVYEAVGALAGGVALRAGGLGSGAVAAGGGLFGRERERRAVLDWLERGLPSLTRGASPEAPPAPPMLVVAGDVGVGKSRLLTELKHHAQIMGATVLEAVCEPSARAYAAVAELLRGLAQVLGAERAAALLEHGGPELRRLLGEGSAEAPLRGVGGAGSGAQDAARERTRLFDAVVGFLQAASHDRALLLQLHDLHRADPGTRALLGHLGRALQPAPAADAEGAPRPDRGRLCLACSARVGPDGQLPWLEGVMDAGCLERVRLGPLDRDATNALVRAMLGSTEVPERLQQEIYRHTGGNPYFIQETVRSLIERRSFARRSGRLQVVGPSDAPEVPQSVAEVLRERLEHLGPREERVLRVLAAARVPLGAVELVSLIGLRGRPLRTALATLVERGMVVPDERAGRRRRYRCVHELLREVVMRGAPAAERKALHARLARFLEARGGERGLEADPAVLAEHFREAGVPGRAFRYAVRAGDEARRLFANERAITHYAQALRVAKEAGADDHDLVQVLESLGVVRERTGDLRRAALAYREAIARARRDESLTSLDEARLHRRLGETQEAAGEYDAALSSFSAGVRALGMDLASPDGARLLGATASVYIKTGRYEEAITWVESGLEMAGPAPTAERASLLNAGGVALLCRGETRAAAERFEESLALREQLGDRQAIARTLNNLGAAYVEAGQFGRAVPYFEDALRRTAEVGDVRGGAETAAHLGSARLSLGEHDRALELFERSLSLAERVGDPDGVLAALQRLARFEIELGYLDDAEGRILRAERVVEGLRHAGVGDRAGGRRGRVDERWPTRECVRAVIVGGRFLLVVGEISDAVRLLDEARSQAQRYGAVREQAEALKLRGRGLAQLGRLDEAERSINEAQTLYGQLGNEYESARSTIDRVDLMVQRGELELAAMALEGLWGRLSGMRMARLLGPLKLVEGRLLAATAGAGDARAIGEALLQLEEARKSARDGRRPELLWRVELAAALACEAGGAPDRALRAAIRGMKALRSVTDRVPQRLRDRYLAHPGRVALRDAFRRLRQAVGG
jgi:tetratricopeptide (TPR) repeat protein